MSNNNSMLKLIGGFCWYEVLEISKNKFNEYKTKGIPSELKQAVAYEKYIDKLEGDSESSGAMIYSPNLKFSQVINETNSVDLSGYLTETDLFEKSPVEKIQTKANSYYLVRIQNTKKASYKIQMQEEFVKAKLKIFVKPEELPGEKIIDCLLIKYNDDFFDYEAGYSNYDSSYTYLVDNKGQSYDIEGSENISN